MTSCLIFWIINWQVNLTRLSIRRKREGDMKGKWRTDRQIDMYKDSEWKQQTEKVRGYKNQEKHCKDSAPSPGLSWAQTPSDSIRKTGDQPWFQTGFVSLHRENMAWNPIIPGYRDVRAPSSSLIPRHRGYGTKCTVYRSTSLKKKKKKNPLTHSHRLERLFSWRANRARAENGWHSFRAAAVFTIFSNFGIPMKTLNSILSRVMCRCRNGSTCMHVQSHMHFIVPLSHTYAHRSLGELSRWQELDLILSPLCHLGSP